MHFIKTSVAAYPLHYMKRDVSGMGGDPLHALDQIEKCYAGRNGTGSVLKTCYMVGLYHLTHPANGIIQGLDTRCFLFIIMKEGIFCCFQSFFGGGHDRGQFVDACRREGDPLFLHILDRIGHFCTVIPDPFIITDGIQDLRYNQDIIGCKTVSVDAEAVIGKRSFCPVQIVFVFLYLTEGLLIIFDQEIYGQVIILADPVSHGLDDTAACFQSNTGCTQQSFLQDPEIRRVGMLVCIAEDLSGERPYLFGEGQQDQGCEDIKAHMHICDISPVHDGGKEFRFNTVIKDAQDNGQNDGSYDIEQKIGQADTLCFFRGADAAKNDGETFSEILSDQHGDGDAAGDGTGCGQGLQDPDKCTGALDQSAEQESNENSEEGVGEGCEEIPELFGFLQRSKDLFHKGHSHKKNAET